MIELGKHMLDQDTQDKKHPTSAPELPKELVVQHGLTHHDDDPATAISDIEASSNTLDNPETTQAIAEITKEDDETLLDIETAPVDKSTEVPLKKRGRIREFFRRWWGNPVARWCTIIGLVVIVIAAGLWPASRYAVLNTVGVRASTTLKVIDAETRLPLKNVTVSASGVTVKTNGDGQATLRGVELGTQTIRIERAAFAPVSLERTLGWGSNPLEDVLLAATGLQLRFTALDYLSAKPVTAAQASVGDAVAVADDQGRIVLTAADPEADTITVELTAQGYKIEHVVMAVASSDAIREIKLVPAQPLVYISKQSGKYDVFKTDIRAEKPELLLAGTGNERRDSLRLVASPDGSTAAFVSTRTTQRDADRYPMSTLTLIQSADGSNRAIDLAQQIEPIAWNGNTLVYYVVYASASSANSQRSKIIAYDTSSSTRKVLATADYFNGAQVIGGTLYYATTQTDPTLPSRFAKISISGNGKATLLEKPVWSMLRTSPTEMSLETIDGWYTYLIGDTAAHRGTAVDYANRRAYTDTPDGKMTAWVDNRDGKGVIVLTDMSTGSERVVASASGLQSPLRWLGAGVLSYRVVTTDETADYAVSINGGEPRKVIDVTDVDGFTFGQ